MPEPLRPVEPVRLRHRHGEALLGRDLTDQGDQDDQLRWWHNRALHRASGVITGLDVVLSGGVATVGPGLAYDGRGRALLLEQAREIAVPDGDPGRALVLSRAAGGVDVCWVSREAAASCDVVRLATDDDADHPTNGRPQTRPIARPRIGRGATIPGATAWQPWVERINDEVWQLGIQVTVDTSTAGFTAPPCYFAQVTGSLWDPRLPALLLVPFDHVAAAGRDRFTFRMLMPWLYLLAGVSRQPDFRDAFRGLAQITELAVTWIGIQHITGGPA
jgi:hypothetical protein